jgi:putative NIF3 family GTP cyclohydrolase 1 type 2
MLSSIKADLYLTGDIKYHDAMLAKALNISMIDIEHFASEKFFSEILAKELKNFGLQAIISQSINPFDYIR